MISFYRMEKIFLKFKMCLNFPASEIQGNKPNSLLKNTHSRYSLKVGSKGTS